MPATRAAPKVRAQRLRRGKIDQSHRTAPASGPWGNCRRASTTDPHVVPGLGNRRLPRACPMRPLCPMTPNLHLVPLPRLLRFMFDGLMAEFERIRHPHRRPGPEISAESGIDTFFRAASGPVGNSTG